MTTLDHAEHLVGIASLISIAVVAASFYLSVGVIFVTLDSEWHRILAALRGEPISPAASVVPLTTALPQQRDVEAVTLPTSPARAALGGVA